MTLLKLPRLYLLTLPVGAELDFDAGRAQEGRRAAGRVVLRADLVPVDSPRLGELVHVELEQAVAAHGVVALVAVVVAAQAAEAPAQVGSGHDLHETVAVPGDLQTCGGAGKWTEMDGVNKIISNYCPFMRFFFSLFSSAQAFIRCHDIENNRKWILY